MAKARRENLLLLYYKRGVYPLRDTIRTHLFCWKRYSRHRVSYVNVALGIPRWALRGIEWDGVIFHTSFLGLRWSAKTFRTYVRRCAFLKGWSCPKIAMPQDEFMNTDVLCDFINDFGITHVLSVAEAKDWPTIYAKVDREHVAFRTILTGYLDPETLRRIERLKKRDYSRDADIGYRAWRSEAWLGEHGMHKVWIGEAFQRAADELGLRADISFREEDVLAGDVWFEFLLRCKAVLGVEAGASVLDARGELKEKVNTYLSANSKANFEEIREHCFPNEDGKLGLQVIAPRHLEACATETCQLLLEGRYSGILEPRKHYIPVKRDYSNVREIAAFLKDKAKISEITTAAHKDVVLSNRWTYERFVRDIEKSVFPQLFAAQAGRSGFRACLAGGYLRLREFLGWQRIKCEVFLFSMMPVGIQQRIMNIVRTLRESRVDREAEE